MSFLELTRVGLEEIGKQMELPGVATGKTSQMQSSFLSLSPEENIPGIKTDLKIWISIFYFLFFGFWMKALCPF